MYFLNCLQLLIVVGIFIETSSARKYEIPNYINLCNKNEPPELEKCILKILKEDIRPHLAGGIKEMGIPPLEPLLVPEAVLNTGGSFNAVFKNIYVYHATDFTIKNFYMNIDKNEVNFPIIFPKLRLKSDYNLKGRILILDLNGHGKADGNLTDVKAVAQLNGIRVNKNGKEYINFNDNRIKIDIRTAKFYFENLINGNRELSEATNKVVNENINEIIEELKPIIEDTIGTIVFSVVRRVFKNFSVDELFPAKI